MWSAFCALFKTFVKSIGPDICLTLVLIPICAVLALYSSGNVFWPKSSLCLSITVTFVFASMLCVFLLVMRWNKSQRRQLLAVVTVSIFPSFFFFLSLFYLSIMLLHCISMPLQTIQQVRQCSAAVVYYSMEEVMALCSCFVCFRITVG